MENKAYLLAKEEFASLGIDTEAAIETLKNIPISIHCWQGDDVVGFDGAGSASGGIQTTGNYMGRARTPIELMDDIRLSFSLMPGKKRLNLHASYAILGNDLGKVDRDAYLPKHFAPWVDFAKELGLDGIDFNPTCFSHDKVKDGLTLSSPDADIRKFWIDHCITCIRIAEYFADEMNSHSLVNIWIPDGLKDVPVNRYRYRELLIESLDKILGTPYTEEEHKYAADVLEGKVFGIGTEAFVVGSHEFYLGYAATHNCGVTLDTGHFNPTENIPDKLSAYRPFVRDLMLHISRGLHWDSDHVLIQDDCLMTIMHEMRMGNLYGDVAMGLDFFDASINRVACWSIGLRAAAKAVLASLLEPVNLTDKAEVEGDFTSRLMLMDEAKNLPMNAVWEYMLMKKDIAIGQDALKAIKTYEKNVMATR